MTITTLWLTDVETSARMDRGILGDLFTEGIRDVQGGQFKVIPRAGGANMTVTVQKGTTSEAVAYIAGDDIADQGTYRVAMDASVTDLAVAAAPSTGSRTDLVVLEVLDKTAVGGTTNLARPRVLTGVSSLGASNKTMIALARIAVAANQVSVQAANITDLRTQYNAAALKIGTQAQPLTQAEIDALTGSALDAGVLAYNKTRKRLQYRDDDSWETIGVPARGVYSFPDTYVPTSDNSGINDAGGWTAMAAFIGAGYAMAHIRLLFAASPGMYAGNQSAEQNEFLSRGNLLEGTIGLTVSEGRITSYWGSGGVSYAQMVFVIDQYQIANRQIVRANGSYPNPDNSAGWLVRNLRITSDGYVRWEARFHSVIGNVTGPNTVPAGGIKLYWEAY